MLEWNVYISNFNSREIEIYNVFDHCGFLKDCVSAKKTERTKEKFAEKIKSSLMCYYWSKSEWEVTIHHWPDSDRMKNKKVDVYQQVRMNWDRFIDYLWDNRRELR